MECGKNYLFLQRRKNDKYLFAFVPSRCKSWSCETCRPIKSKIVRDYVQKNFRSKTLYMLTLTFYHSGTALEAWEKLGACWNRLRTYVAKIYGPFRYLRIVEPHKKGGWPHVHVLIDGCVVDRRILRKVTDWGFGWNAQVEPVSTEIAALYISKYLSKKWPDTQADLFRRASRCRIVSVSRGMPAIFTPKGEWEAVHYDLPNDRASFVCNVVIDILRSRDYRFIICRPFAGGFIIESGASLPIDWMYNFPDPYVWQWSDDFEYSFAPYGIQEELTLFLK